LQAPLTQNTQRRFEGRKRPLGPPPAQLAPRPGAREALEVFGQAAEQERVTVELIQKITEFLLEARHNQRLRLVAPG
jgi:hypothetical protein